MSVDPNKCFARCNLIKRCNCGIGRTRAEYFHSHPLLAESFDCLGGSGAMFPQILIGRTEEDLHGKSSPACMEGWRRDRTGTAIRHIEHHSMTFWNADADVPVRP